MYAYIYIYTYIYIYMYICTHLCIYPRMPGKSKAGAAESMCDNSLAGGRLVFNSYVTDYYSVL